MKVTFKIVITGLILTYLSTVTKAADNERSVTYKVEAPEEVKVGENIDIKVILDIKKGWHIYAPNGFNASQGLIESYIEFTSPKGMTAGEVKIPKPVDYGTTQIYRGGVVMSQSLISKEGLAPGIYKIRGTVSYQACNVEYCEPPLSMPVSLKVAVVEK